MKLEARVMAMQMRLRAFAFGAELDQQAREMLSLLAIHRKSRADVDDRTRLKALALMAEYLDSHGRSQEAGALLRLTSEALLDGQIGAGDDLKLMRQRVWCCLAYALTHLRANRTREAGKVILAVREFVDVRLIRPEFPCHGTVALLRYYEGLWRRNIGELDHAARACDGALDRARMRYEEKRAKYEGIDGDRLRRELVYFRVMMARILGFGHGGIALARGRHLEARGWMIAASQFLSQLGQEHWRRGLEVYERCAAVLVADLENGSIARLNDEALKLRGLAEWFASRNRRNGFVAAAFGVVAEVRVRQIESGEVRRVNLAGLRKRLGFLLKEAYADAGPLSGSAALGLIECLLRGGEFEDCARELERFKRVFQGEQEVLAEQKVLQAELWIETGRMDSARGLLEELVSMRVANRGYRARAWALLALCERSAGRIAWAERALVAAREAAEIVQDGLTRALVREIGLTFGAAVEVAMAMPYQTDGEDALWCDVDHNLEMARLNVVAAVLAKHPDYGVEKLAIAMGRGVSWLYALLGRHRDVEWVRALMASRSV